MVGPRIVLLGAVTGAVALSLFLYKVSAGATYPAAPASAQAQAQPQAVSVQVAADASLPSTAQDIASGGACAVSEKYPQNILKWCDLITRYASKRNLPPDLVAALIWQESGGKPAVYSHSGAVGLMQIMPKDGVAASFMCINGPCFADRPSSTELEDPEFNISFGTKMLARLHSRTGDLREALKSYGPMNVGYSYADKVISLYERYGTQAQ